MNGWSPCCQPHTAPPHPSAGITEASRHSLLMRPRRRSPCEGAGTWHHASGSSVGGSHSEPPSWQGSRKGLQRRRGHGSCGGAYSRHGVPQMHWPGSTWSPPPAAPTSRGKQRPHPAGQAQPGHAWGWEVDHGPGSSSDWCPLAQMPWGLSSLPQAQCRDSLPHTAGAPPQLRAPPEIRTNPLGRWRLPRPRSPCEPGSRTGTGDCPEEDLRQEGFPPTLQ